MPQLIFGTLALVALIAGLVVYAVKQSKKEEQDDLKASAAFAEACEDCKSEITEEAIKIELAKEPKVSKKKPAKKTAKKKAKKPVKKEVAVSTFELQPVAPKPRKSRAKKPTV
jgi:hypothetical protein